MAKGQEQAQEVKVNEVPEEVAAELNQITDTSGKTYISKVRVKVYFVEAHSFFSKKTRKDFHIMSVVQLLPDGKAKPFSSFVNGMPALCESLRFGDCVLAEFGIFELDQKPDLLTVLELVTPSPIVSRSGGATGNK
jgi:hypothetical protein